MSKVIGVIGTRRRDTKMDLLLTVRAFYKIYSLGDTIVSGGCPKGGDRFAEVLAEETILLKRIPITIHLPDKSTLDQTLMERNPRAAYAVINYARNKLIARDADVLIACVAEDRKGGTEDTIKHFRKKLGKTEAQLIAERLLILV